MSTCSSSSSLSIAPTSDPQPQQTNPVSEPEQELIPSLPYDIALNCLARVPQYHHRTLSLVSKPIRSLVSSPLFFNTRSLLHATQPVLYLHLHLHHSPCPFQWFAVSLNPLATTPTLRLPTIPSPTRDPSCALLGTDIYVIGGSFLGRFDYSPDVWVLDCRFNCWRQGPTMRVPRRYDAAAVLDGKIYVMGGVRSHTSGIWAEVLDPAVGSWEEVVSPFDSDVWLDMCVVVGGKIYVAFDYGRSYFAYDPRNGVWESVENEVYMGYYNRACSVGGVLYSWICSHAIEGLDVGPMREGEPWEWKEVKGLEKLPGRLWGIAANPASGGARLFPVGKNGWDGKQHWVWCSQVEVHKNNEDGEFWGRLCWSLEILPFRSEDFVDILVCLAVGL